MSEHKTKEDKTGLYKAAKEVVNASGSTSGHREVYRKIYLLKQSVESYEKQSSEQNNEHKTREEILESCGRLELGAGDFVYTDGALKAMQLYSDQQTSLFTQQLADKIKVEFSDECINEKLRTPDVKSGMIEMRDEILNRLK